MPAICKRCGKSVEQNTMTDDLCPHCHACGECFVEAKCLSYNARYGSNLCIGRSVDKNGLPLVTEDNFNVERAIKWNQE